MGGTLPAGGSSMPPSNQVKVIKATPTSIQPATNEAGTGVPGTPMSSGAPGMAPSQTIAQTGGGAISEDAEGFQAAGGLVAPPASHGSTGPQIAAPSVNYDSQQGDNIPNLIRHPNAVTPLGQQDQRT